MTPNYSDEHRAAAHAALARQELLAFATYIDPTYQCPQHIKYLAGYLEAVADGRCQRLLITFPPQHGKSELISGKFPGWMIGRHPDQKIIMVGHSASFIETFSIQNRDTIGGNPKYHDVFPEVWLKPERRSASVWAVRGARETLICNGITGGITGYGANGIILDDVIKTHEQASSPTYKEKCWNEYLTAVRTRLSPNGWVVVVGTRWAEDDLIGRLLTQAEIGGEHWEIVHLPALSYGVMEDYGYGTVSVEDYDKAIKNLPKTAFPDPLGRHKGEPLWPERYTQRYLQSSKAVMRHLFECLYQGNPSAPEGSRFKKDWFINITQETLNQWPLEIVAKARSIDLGFSGSPDADFTAGLRATLYQLKGDAWLDDNRTIPVNTKVVLVLEDLLYWRQEWPTTARLLEEALVADGPSYTCIIEAIAAQNIGFKSLKANPRLWQHTILPVLKQQGDTKDAWLAAAMNFASLGMVFVLCASARSEPDWLAGFLTELGTPNPTHDDRADVFAQLLNFWQGKIDNILAETTPDLWSSPLHRDRVSIDVKRRQRPLPFQTESSSGPLYDLKGWT